MRIINKQSNPVITIVGCMHGNEYLGLHVMREFEHRVADYPTVQFLLANEPAIAADTRFLDQDLNRSFPGNGHGTHEQQLATEILPHLLSSRFVLDLHTTTSPIRMTPIVTSLGNDTKRIINLCNSREVALVEPPLSNASLIGQCTAGVSLEYNGDYAETPEAVADVFRIIDGLLRDIQEQPRVRDVFHIVGSTPSAIEMPTDTQNFIYSPVINGFPFLFGERAYPNGLVASQKTETAI